VLLGVCVRLCVYLGHFDRNLIIDHEALLIEYRALLINMGLF